MKQVEFADPHRRKHFEFFNAMEQPHFSVTAQLEITAFKTHLEQHGLRFTPSVVYCVSKIANDIGAFRRRIRKGSVVEHELVHPSFAVMPDVSDVFSFCYVDFTYDFRPFISAAEQSIERVKQHPVFEDDAQRDDYLFLSIFPWFSFTSITHAMHRAQTDSVPRIVWGKYFTQGDALMMPVSVQAHHAVVDGHHVGQYFMRLQQLFQHPEQLI